MIITTLIEDSIVESDQRKPDQLLTCKHGLSLYIESNGLKILFDTGPDVSIIANAEKLSVDLTEVDFAVVSHGHYDHGGGVSAFCRKNVSAPIYLHKKSYQDAHFSQRPGSGMKNADFKIDKTYFSRIVSIDKLPLGNHKGVRRLDSAGKVVLIAGFPKDGYIPSGNKNLYSQKSGEDIVNDDFSHEIAMLIRDNEKNILFTGCSHSGVGNMIKRAIEVVDGGTIDYVIGGFHLIDTEQNRSNSQKDLQILVDELAAYPGTQFYTGHCTGQKPLQFLQQMMGKNRIHEIKTGYQFSINKMGGEQ